MISYESLMLSLQILVQTCNIGLIVYIVSFRTQKRAGKKSEAYRNSLTYLTPPKPLGRCRSVALVSRRSVASCPWSVTGVSGGE